MISEEKSFFEKVESFFLPLVHQEQKLVTFDC